MKETLGPDLTHSTPLRVNPELVEGLTNSLPPAHNGGKGVIFMPDDRGQELPPTPPPETPKEITAPEPPPQLKPAKEPQVLQEGPRRPEEIPGTSAKRVKEALETGRMPAGGAQEGVVRTSWIRQEGDLEIEHPRLKAWVEEQERVLAILRGREPEELLRRLGTSLNGLKEELDNELGVLLERQQRGELSEAEFTQEMERLNRYSQEVERYANRVAERLTQAAGYRGGVRETGYLSRGELLLIAQNERESEQFLENILSLPEARKEEFYSLDYVSEVNLRSFLQILRQIDETRYHRYLDIWGMRSRFHSMGVLVRTGDINRFLEVAQQIYDTHLQTAVGLEGVEQVRQLYEKALASRLGEKPTIRPEDYRWIEDWVHRQFLALAQKKGWENWKAERALTVGSNMHAITLRIAEYIAKGEIPERGPERFSSFHFESAVRTLAVYKWVAFRFRVGAATRGEAFFDTLIRTLEKGEDASTLDYVGAVKRKEFELPALHEASGYESGYRQTLAYLNTLVLPEELRDIAGDGRYLATNVGEYLTRLNDPDFQGDRRAALERLIEKTHLSLGILLAQDLTFEGKLTKADAVEMKARIWGKAAKVLPSRLIYLLRKERINYLRQKINPGNSDDVTESQIEQYWQAFWPELEKKIALLEIERVENQWGNHELVRLDLAGLSADEQEFVSYFQELGARDPNLLRELAKVKFSTTPFLDDVSHADYLATGTESFKRRLGNDIPAFFNAGNEVTNLVDNLEMAPPKVRETIKKMVKNLATPHGDRLSKAMAAPFIKVYLQEAKEYSWATWIPGVGGIAQWMHIPTSNLQKAFGPTAPSLGPGERREELHHYQGENIQTKEQVKRLQKELGAELWRKLANDAETLFIFILITWIIEFFKKLKEAK